MVSRERLRALSTYLAEVVTRFSGSMAFVLFHAVLFAVWTTTGLFGLDPFPFNFLTLTVSLEAIFLSAFVMISQNRSSERDAQRNQHDLETDLEAEHRIEVLQEHLARLEEEKLDEILRLLRNTGVEAP